MNLACTRLLAISFAGIVCGSGFRPRHCLLYHTHHSSILSVSLTLTYCHLLIFWLPMVAHIFDVFVRISSFTVRYVTHWCITRKRTVVDSSVHMQLARHTLRSEYVNLVLRCRRLLSQDSAVCHSSCNLASDDYLGRSIGRVLTCLFSSQLVLLSCCRFTYSAALVLMAYLSVPITQSLPSIYF